MAVTENGSGNNFSTVIDGAAIPMAIFKSGLAENMGVEVEIASLYQAVQKLLPLPFFRAPSWTSSRMRRRVFPGMTPLKSPSLKMGDIHRTPVSNHECDDGSDTDRRSFTSTADVAKTILYG